MIRTLSPRCEAHIIRTGVASNVRMVLVDPTTGHVTSGPWYFPSARGAEELLDRAEYLLTQDNAAANTDWLSWSVIGVVLVVWVIGAVVWLGLR